MKKSLFRVIGIALAVSIAAPFAHAGDSDFPNPRMRKKAEQQAKAERQGSGAVNIERSKRKNGLLLKWWQDEVAIFQDGQTSKSRISKSQSAERRQAAFVDPEAVQGFGMGNIPFVLPKMQLVQARGLVAPATLEPDAESIRLVLSDSQTPIRASAAVRDVVLAHYTATGFKPLWTNHGKLTSRAVEILSVLDKAFEEGLEPNRYLPRVLTSFSAPDAQIEGSALAAAQLDVGLTVAVLTYADHMTGGAFDPSKLSLYHDIKTEAAEPATVLRVLAFTPFPKAYLESMVPKHPAYVAMKSELAALRAKPQNETPFPVGKRIKIGQKDERVPELRGRLIRLGHLDAEKSMPEGGDPLVLDKYVGRALKAYQAAAGIPQTSAVDTATTTALNGNSSATNITRLIINMERVRWLPKDLGKKHVFVNQAAYEVEVRDQGQKIWESKVIVGRPTTQTNVFSDVMENVVFNPSWGMPQSILINEYLGKLRRDPGYFDRIGYQVTNSSGKVVSSRSINWGSVSASSGVGVRQPPGDGNALGELKFNFPNHHAIYMHDTPNRNLFDESRRNFSHGCVRVQNPRDFAALLLGLSVEDVGSKLASGESYTQKLQSHVPVHLHYFTAWPDDEGNMRYFADPYERDETLIRGLDVVAKAFAPDQSIKVVEASAAATAQ